MSSITITLDPSGTPPSDSYVQPLVNVLPADFVRVWTTVQQTASLIIYYADDLSGNNTISERFTLSPNNSTAINSFLKKSCVSIKVQNHSAYSQSVTVRTKYDQRPVPSVSAATFVNILTDNITANVETLNNINISTSTISVNNNSTILAYGTTGYLEANHNSLLTDTEGRVIIVTKDDKLSITGPVGISGTIGITGPVSTTGQVLIQTNQALPQTAVSISGNINCNINGDQYVSVNDTVSIVGNIQGSIVNGQLISVSGPVSVTGTVNLVNFTPNLPLSENISISGSINCNIDSSQNQVGIIGAAYTTLTDISAGLSYILNAPMINTYVSIGNIYGEPVSLVPWEQTLPIGIKTFDVSFGIDCILTYQDNTLDEGDIAILGLTNFNPSNWEYIGIITPTVSEANPTSRWASTTINVAPFKFLRIQNLSNVTRLLVICSLLTCKSTGIP